MNSPRSDHVASIETINKSHFIAPNRHVSGFIGREDILGQIEKGLSSESQPRVVVLHGLGGQGKTQIALEYCHRARKNNIRKIFWVDATSANTIKKDLTQFGDTARLAEEDHDIELPGLPKNDACDLLIRQSRVGDAASRDDAYTIVVRLGNHALAITQAGLMMRNKYKSVILTLFAFFDCQNI
ncbi:c0661188-b94c-4c28-a59a-103b5f97c816 [Sclerotinia trifoliorum]|uniref:C0661188-b94c-4c28-a59a-103b5f97c816 n=1 Tax=Sclerotinia trifoliorum TaxID=28548 RepID=A0A8H2ZRR8_9HELO|nr:c0661188-b94c-4c28-a59a-103b5f97c816 [Sclerotinia trifoliorum]